jgi:hypothetical protein
MPTTDDRRSPSRRVPSDRPTLHLHAAPLPDPCPVCGIARRIVGRDGDVALFGCGSAYDDAIATGATSHHVEAAELRRPAILAAMAAPPKWLRAYTLGRPAWSYAVGDGARLLWAALEERKRGEGGPATDAYFAAIDTRFAKCAEAGRFAPGAWQWAPHEEGTAPGLVPDGGVLVCTCRPAQSCHLDKIGPHLVRAGWRVIGRDGLEVGL